MITDTEAASGFGSRPAAPLVLASTSMTRQAILRQAGVPFDAVPPGVDEAVAKASLLAAEAGPRDVADALAELKAVKVGRRTGALTLGCDQTLDLDGELFDKPGSLVEVKGQLKRLRGRTHKLHAAAVLVEAGRPIWREVETASLTMRSFSDSFLDEYLKAAGEAVSGSVGGYHIEGLGLQLFDRVEGDHFAILGLPMTGLLRALRQRRVLQA